MLPHLPWFVGASKNLNGGWFTTIIVFFAFILYFVNITNGGGSFTFSTGAEFDSNGTSIDLLYKSFYLQYNVTLLYYGIMLHSHTIPDGKWHINNYCCNNLDLQLCTMWGTLEYNSNIFQSNKIRQYSEISYPKYFLNSLLLYLTADYSTTKICL